MAKRLTIRQDESTDHGQIVVVIPSWWGGRDLSYAVPRLFLDHFANTSLVMEDDGCMVGFLVGFMSPSRPEEGYAHFLGVDPAYHGQGIGKRLYETFFELCRQNGRTMVRACTSPVYKALVGFHKKMGFSLAPGDGESDGIPFIKDYNRPGDDKVEFFKRMD